MARGKEFNLRIAVLLRDNNKCRWCGGTEGLQVHHLNYEKSTVDQLITLCKDCHTHIHLIERTHVYGDLSFIWCGNCRNEDGALVAQFITRNIANHNKIWVCPNCGRGIRDNREAETLDKWTSPFHKEMMELYPPTAMEIWG